MWLLRLPAGVYANYSYLLCGQSCELSHKNMGLRYEGLPIKVIC